MECYELVDSEGCNWTIYKEKSNKDNLTLDKSEDCQKDENIKIKNKLKYYKLVTPKAHSGMIHKEGL